MTFIHRALPEAGILESLKRVPGTVMVANSGEDLYVADSGGTIHFYHGLDWGSMTNDEISAWLAAHPLD